MRRNEDNGRRKKSEEREWRRWMRRRILDILEGNSETPSGETYRIRKSKEEGGIKVHRGSDEG